MWAKIVDAKAKSLMFSVWGAKHARDSLPFPELQSPTWDESKERARKHYEAKQFEQFFGMTAVSINLFKVVDREILVSRTDSVLTLPSSAEVGSDLKSVLMLATFLTIMGAVWLIFGMFWVIDQLSDFFKTSVAAAKPSVSLKPKSKAKPKPKSESSAGNQDA